MDKINLSNYNILIFAAGIGSRIGPIGKKIPKSLLRINQKRIIDHLIEILIKKKVKEIIIMVGYKSELLKQYLDKYKSIKIRFKNIKNYAKVGHSYTWYNYKNIWKNSKNPTFLFHSDILFSKKFLDNLIKSNSKNLIGIKKVKKILNEEVFYVSASGNFIKKIAKKPNIERPIGEIIGINKISYNSMKKLFLFMEEYFKYKERKKFSWEVMLNDYIQKNPKSFKILRNQNYKWVNINRINDYNYAKRIFKN